MTIQALMGQPEFTPVFAPDDNLNEITVPFCCDLLSIAMGRAPAHCAWVTVMANINTLAVASLTECTCIILAEGTEFDDTCIQKAISENIPVFTTELPVFEAALAVWKLLPES